jgi:hypothetical protein
LRFDVITDAGFNAFEVGIDRSKDASFDQEFLLDQFRDLRTLDNDIENAAETTAVAAAGCGRQAEKDRIGIFIDDTRPRLTASSTAVSIWRTR